MSTPVAPEPPARDAAPDVPSAAAERTLSHALAMDAVTLHVGDLEAMSSYYANALALQPLEERSRPGGAVHRVLGRGDVPFVRLVSTPGLPVVDPRQAGLFHTAFLLEGQEALAATLLRAAQDPRTRYVGSADHLVSEAFYLTDPEGNGIELYRDRPREDWSWRDGQVVMDSLPLDPQAYLAEHLPEGEPDAAAGRGVVGHVHLQVGDIARARSFYLDALGFETTVGSHPGALFASAGGYHHHVAMNTWNSRGAGPRAAGLGLADVAITVPGREDLDALVARSRRAGLAAADDGRSVRLVDPWGTPVTVSTPGTTTEQVLAR